MYGERGPVIVKVDSGERKKILVSNSEARLADDRADGAAVTMGRREGGCGGRGGVAAEGWKATGQDSVCVQRATLRAHS